MLQTMEDWTRTCRPIQASLIWVGHLKQSLRYKCTSKQSITLYPKAFRLVCLYYPKLVKDSCKKVQSKVNIVYGSRRRRPFKAENLLFMMILGYHSVFLL